MQGAYLEDYQKIKVILKNETKFDVNNIYICDPVLIKMELSSKKKVNSYWHLEYNVSTVLKTHIDYYIYINEEEQLHLNLGKITRTPLFEQKNFTKEKLGFIYNKEWTEFRLWTPTAKEVIIILPNLKVEYHLNYSKNGIWKFKVYGDLDKEPYYYMVRINDLFVKCLDPYAISSSINSEYNFVIDLNNTYQQKYSKPSFSGNLTDSIILEMHLKDFGYLLPGNESYYRKAYMETDNIGLNYIKQLGITHVQLLPLNAFAGIDEKNPDKLYNWGYNPVEYFSPTNWYSTKPDDPYCSINELKELIDIYHKNGLLVNLDVVYNHVYDWKTFSLNILVPGYVFRTDHIDYMTNGSGCGNDLATERLMVRRLIVDSLNYFTNEFGFDGYRFDLMGLIDIETMKEIQVSLKQLNPNIILYGEGWEMKTGLSKDKLAFNKDQLLEYGYFNDYFRNIIKGNPFSLEKGLITEGSIKIDSLSYLVKGSYNPSQSINFIECHDNYTVFDQMSLTLPNLSFDKRQDYLKLGLQLVMISEGIPFLHLGTEFGRSKNNIDNSYNLSISINKVDWSKITEYQEVINSLKDIITLRKNIKAFRLTTKEEVEKKLIINKQSENYLEYTLLDDDSTYQVIVTNSYDEIQIKESGTLIFDGRLKNLVINECIINKPGVYIIRK